MTDDRADALAGATWSCARTAAGAAASPGELPADLEWLPATVPGTAAGALRAAGRWRWGHDDEELLDGSDWWWRTTVPGGGPARLRLDGLATIADVWLAGRHLLHSESMFLPHAVDLGGGRSDEELLIRCGALAPLLARRRPRPRWRSLLHRSQQLRWYRTTTLGRNGGWTRWGAPVGPWRPVSLEPVGPGRIRSRTLRASVAGSTGRVDVEIVADDPGLAVVEVEVAGTRAVLAGEGGRFAGSVEVPGVERWWPHTHGEPVRHAVTAHLDGRPVGLGSVGFRTVEVDRRDGAFTVAVNGQAVFCRGAAWDHPDVVSLNCEPAELRAALVLACDAGMNLLRVGGHTVYQEEAFWDLCDELGILVWQDCMIAAYDPPEDDAWLALLAQEVEAVFTRAAAHPSLAVACGSTEVHQQASMYGLPAGTWASTALDETIPEVIARCAPGTPYLASTPSGGTAPFHPDQGVTHFFGVGAYLRPAREAALAGVRFATECLTFAVPAERPTVEAAFGGARVGGHVPEWKAVVPRDASTAWDFEDVTAHYVQDRFGVGPLDVRYADPDFALDLQRAAIADLMAEVMAGWRRPSSPCAGALVLSWADLAAGTGWGLIDATGAPKSTWYALRRVLAPTAVTVTDDGLVGYGVQVHHDGADPFTGSVHLDVVGPAGSVLEHGEQTVQLGPHESIELRALGLIGAFRDLNDAYRFGPSPYDAVLVRLVAADGRVVARTVRPCAPALRPRMADIGLTATARPAAGGWTVEVATAQLAQFVVVEVQGGAVGDAWFHLEAGGTRTLPLRLSGTERPVGTVRALNARFEVPVTVEAEGHEGT